MQPTHAKPDAAETKGEASVRWCCIVLLLMSVKQHYGNNCIHEIKSVGNTTIHICMCMHPSIRPSTVRMYVRMHTHTYTHTYIYISDLSRFSKGQGTVSEKRANSSM